MAHDNTNPTAALVAALKAESKAIRLQYDGYSASGSHPLIGAFCDNLDDLFDLLESEPVKEGLVEKITKKMMHESYDPPAPYDALADIGLLILEIRRLRFENAALREQLAAMERTAYEALAKFNDEIFSQLTAKGLVHHEGCDIPGILEFLREQLAGAEQAGIRKALDIVKYVMRKAARKAARKAPFAYNGEEIVEMFGGIAGDCERRIAAILPSQPTNIT